MRLDSGDPGSRRCLCKEYNPIAIPKIGMNNNASGLPRISLSNLIFQVKIPGMRLAADDP
jgi:hypothetical protein